MIHQYKLSGYNIVLDVYSGSVHAVDDVAYDAIALIDQGSSREQAAAALAKKYADRADVTAADISAEAIAMAKRNAERNNLDNMDFLCEDTFALLPRLEKEGSPYDFIILDPPAFTKARRTVENAMRGYKEINYRAMKLLPRGGYLATASCSHFATEELFIKMLRAAAKDAHLQPLRHGGAVFEDAALGGQGRRGAAAADRGAAAVLRPPHSVGRAGDKLPQVFPVSGHLMLLQ